jgi:hypothetical protein
MRSTAGSIASPDDDAMTIHRTLSCSVIAAIAIAVASPAFAQPDPQGQGVGQARRERIKKRIRALRAYTLTEELALDETAASRLFPILARYDDEMGKHVATRFRLKQDLDAAVARNDDRSIDRLIDELVANQSALHALDTKRFGEVRKVLTPRQSARLIVVLPAIERKVQNMLQRAVEGRGAGGGRRGRRGRTVDEDDGNDLIDPFSEPPARGRGRRAAPSGVKDPFGDE